MVIRQCVESTLQVLKYLGNYLIFQIGIYFNISFSYFNDFLKASVSSMGGGTSP